MSKKSVYKSSTLGDIPLSFTARALMDALRTETTEMAGHIKAGCNIDSVRWEPVSRARGRLAQYISDLETKCDERKVQLNNVYGASLQDQFVREQYQKIQDFVINNRLYKDPSKSHAEILLALAQELLDARKVTAERIGAQVWGVKGAPCDHAKNYGRTVDPVPAKERVTEHLYEIDLGAWQVRLWLKQKENPKWLKATCARRFNLLSPEGHDDFQKELAKDLSITIPGVSAVQVKAHDGYSVVIYPEWP